MSDWTNPQPMYQRVADDLRAKIESGEYAAGDALPPTSALMKQYDIANATVQKALRALKAAGLVDSRKGSRVTVREIKRQISRSADYIAPVDEGEPPRYRLPSDRLVISREVPADDIAEALNLDEGEEAVKRSRVMVDNGTVVELVASFIPAPIAENTELEQPRKLRGGMPSALRRLGYPPRGAREWVDSRMPTPDEIRLLNLRPGVPVFRLLRLVWTDEERPIEALEMILGADRYRLEYDLPMS